MQDLQAYMTPPNDGDTPLCLSLLEIYIFKKNNNLKKNYFKACMVTNLGINNLFRVSFVRIEMEIEIDYNEN